MITKKEKEIEKFFKEREDFINSVKNKNNSKTYFCQKHNVFVRIGIACPLCLLEKNKKVVNADDVEERKRKNREKKRKEMLDPEKRAKHYERMRKYKEKERKRKAEHAIT